MALADTAPPTELEAFVACRAPRPFALVEAEDGCPVEILAWGLDAGENTYIVGPEGDMRGLCSSADQARSLFAYDADSVQVVWLRSGLG